MSIPSFRRMNSSAISKSLRNSHAQDSLIFSNLEEAGSYLQSYSGKMNSSKRAMGQNISFTYSESNDDIPVDENKQTPAPNQKKVEIKNPTMSNSHYKGELKNRIEKLGLENLMKELLTGENPATDHSNKIIFALNKTYLTKHVDYQPKGMVATIGRKSSKTIKKRPEPNVNWNQQSAEDSFSYNPSEYIPNSLFPCRKNQTKLLKSRQRINMKYRSSESSFSGLTPKDMQSYQSPSTPRVSQKPPENSGRPKSGDVYCNNIISTLRKSMEKTERKAWSAQTQSARDKSSMRRSLNLQTEKQTALLTQRARIHY